MNSALSDLVVALEWYILFIISATVHEAAHAWMAKRGGDLTAYEGGQVSLNPFPHIKREPLGMVVIPLVSALVIGWPFGYAKTPYDPFWAHNNPRKAAWMAVAGPAANLLLLLICVLVVKIGIFSGFFMEPYSVGFEQIVDPGINNNSQGLVTFISMFFSMNLILVILNLIPLPPLDGSNIISLFLHDDAARKYRSVISNPVFAIVGFLVAWQAFGPLFRLIFPGVMNLVYWGANFHY